MANMIQTLNYVKPESMESTIVDTVDDFCNGKTAMLLSFTEFAQKISFQYQRSLRQRIGFYHIPSRRTASAGWNLGLNPFSPHREEAFEFLSWVCEQKTSFLLAVLNGAPQFVAPYHNHDLQRMYPWLPYSEASVHTSQKRNPPYQKNRLSIPPQRYGPHSLHGVPQKSSAAASPSPLPWRKPRRRPPEFTPPTAITSVPPGTDEERPRYRGLCTAASPFIMTAYRNLTYLR